MTEEIRRTVVINQRDIESKTKPNSKEKNQDEKTSKDK